VNSIVITGGTGSFGHAFVEFLLNNDLAKRIVIYSRSEYAQAQMRERFNDSRLRWFIGDVRDVDRLRRAFANCEVVVHAAALKRIEVGHYNPDEMIKTNILGTMNAISAAAETIPCVRRFVFLSSDKAFQPISPYGQSKALAETLVLNANNIYGEFGPKFIVTRYGNVAGSRGSVIPRWLELLRNGEKKVPVSDPDCTRFWMHMDEAVALVHDAIQNGEAGDVLIPTLPAYRLGDLAEVMGAEMDVLGLPPWEKKHESMSEDQCSATALRMSKTEIEIALRNVA